MAETANTLESEVPAELAQSPESRRSLDAPAPFDSPEHTQIARVEDIAAAARRKGSPRRSETATQLESSKPPPAARTLEAEEPFFESDRSEAPIRAIGLTIALTIGIALALSLLPLPDALRPFPALTTEPLLAMRTAMWPTRSESPTRPQLVGAELDDAPPESMVFEAMDLSGRGVDEAETRKWERLIKAVNAVHAPAENPCVTPNPTGCTDTALSAFFANLRGITDGTAKEPIRVVTIGTSQIASDHITDVTRRLMQNRHGSGGLGFMFVDRPTRNSGRTVRSGAATDGWTIQKVTDEKPLTQAGLAGVAFSAWADSPQETSFLIEDMRRAELFLLTQPGGGTAKVLADGASLGDFPTDGPALQSYVPSILIPPGTKKLLVRTQGAVRLDGVVLENGKPGVVFDSMGLPGASASVLLRDDPRLFATQMAQRNPALVILMIGGNEAFDISVGRYTLAKAKDWMQELITRVKSAAPRASCLLAAPLDAGIWRMDKTISVRKETKFVNAFMRELAVTNGCGFFDMQAAMGGEGSIERWWKAGMMNQDLVHPWAPGADVLGYLLDAAIEQARQAFEASRPPAPRPQPKKGRTQHGPDTRPASSGAPTTHPQSGEPDAGTMIITIAEDPNCATCSLPIKPWVFPWTPDAGPGAEPAFLTNPEALAPFFRKLEVLQTYKSGRVAIAQLGASHTAAQFFTDEMRTLLADRFGYAGRGFVAAGKSSDRLKAAGVTRALIGEWTVSDAMAVKTSGLTWGLTGIRAEASPGAELLMSFDEPGAGPDDSARLQIFYQEHDGGAPPEIRVGGETVIVPAPTPEDTTHVRVLQLGAAGGQHVVSILNPGPGQLSVFGVSHELMRPGIVYDALGLPGSTAAMLAAYAQQPLAQQLEAREVDLFVLFFGTNESSLPGPMIEEMKRSYPLLLATLKLASPDAACLVLGPTDRMSKRRGTPWREAPSINAVQDSMREIANANGCAFWSTRDAMGGKGSIELWRKQKLALGDHVHLSPAGYQKLAGGLVSELLADYDAWRAAK